VESRIFAKQALVRPSQLLAVAERRFADAAALCATGENARANGAQYLAGITLDILLKAQLMRQHPVVGRKRSHEVEDADRLVWSLIWRSHDLADMLGQLPDLVAAVSTRGEEDGKPYLQWLYSICSVWTVFVRYSTRTSTMADAREMLERVRELKEILK
jgi:hypothetical protein